MPATSRQARKLRRHAGQGFYARATTSHTRSQNVATQTSAGPFTDDANFCTHLQIALLIDTTSAVPWCIALQSRACAHAATRVTNGIHRLQLQVCREFEPMQAISSLLGTSMVTLTDTGATRQLCSGLSFL